MLAIILYLLQFWKYHYKTLCGTANRSAFISFASTWNFSQLTCTTVHHRLFLSFRWKRIPKIDKLLNKHSRFLLDLSFYLKTAFILHYWFLHLVMTKGNCSLRLQTTYLHLSFWGEGKAFTFSFYLLAAENLRSY